MTPPPPTPDNLKAGAIVGIVISVITTGYRTYERSNNGRFGWDDGTAIAALAFFLVFFAAIISHLRPPDELSRGSAIAASYLICQGYYAVIWLARISIMISVIRISPNTREKNQLKVAIGLFVIMWMFLSGQTIYVCEKNQPYDHWQDLPTVQCNLGDAFAIAQLISVVVADTLLVAAPIRALWRVQDRGLRFRLIALFSAVFLMSIVSIVHTTYIMLGEAFLINGAMTAVVESGLAIVVCNLTVIYSALYRLVGGAREKFTASPTESPNKTSGRSVTTIGGTGIHIHQTRKTAYDGDSPAPAKDLDGWKNVTGGPVVVRLAPGDSQASLSEVEMKAAPSFNYNQPVDRSPSMNTNHSLSPRLQRLQLESPIGDYIFDGSRPHWRTLDPAQPQEPVQMRVRGEEFEIYTAPRWQARGDTSPVLPASPTTATTPISSVPLIRK